MYVRAGCEAPFSITNCLETGITRASPGINTDLIGTGLLKRTTSPQNIHGYETVNPSSGYMFCTCCVKGGSYALVRECTVHAMAVRHHESLTARRHRGSHAAGRDRTVCCVKHGESTTGQRRCRYWDVRSSWELALQMTGRDDNPSLEHLRWGALRRNRCCTHCSCLDASGFAWRCFLDR